MKRIWFYIFIFVVTILSLPSCFDKSVDNLNDPDSGNIIGSADDVINLAGSSFAVFFTTLQDMSGPAINMEVMADASTLSWGKWRDLSSEPRVEWSKWNNEPNYPYYYTTTDLWDGSYSILSNINDILYDIENFSLDFESEKEKNMIVAWSRFIQGLVHGYLGLIFDQGFIVDENVDAANLELASYRDLVDEGINKLNQTISFCSENQFILPNGFVRGHAITNVELEQMARTFKAKFMISWPRNGTESEEIEWDLILNTLTTGTGGLDWDLAPDSDGTSIIDLYKVYLTFPGWGRTDHRIINLMDSDYPSRWPDESNWSSIGLTDDPGEASSVDARLLSDFEYMPTQNFRPERGHYHFSHYSFSRYDNLYNSAWYGNGPTPWALAWEASLMEAEALLETGNRAAAIAILNSANGPRKTRGGLPDIDTGASDEEVASAIHYEMEIECHNSNAGYSFFGMRRRDMLQYGTINHWPIPKNEQEFLGIPVYTIGDHPPDGKHRALYGWEGLDGQVVPLWPGYPDKGVK